MPRILLVDDDIAEIAALKRALGAAGHEPLLATNATDAVAAVEQGVADAVVVAPECEGGEGAALVGRLERMGVPIVALARPVDAEALGAALAAATSKRRGPTPAPAPAASSAASSGSLAPRSGERVGERGDAPSALRAPTFDTSLSPAAEAAELRGAERDLIRAQEQRVPAVPARPPPAPHRAAPPRRRPLDRAWVEEMLRQAEQADYFDLLGLPPDCGRDDVLQTAGRLLDELALDRCPASDAMLLDKVEEIRRVLAEARDVLGDDRLREDYRSALRR